jgi:hypothetical protein
MATTAVLNLGINTREFTTGLTRASGSLLAFATSGPVLLGAAFAGMSAGLGAVGFSFIKAAADAEETTNKFNAVFAGLNKEADETAKNLAKNFGLSSREAEKLLGDTGDLLTGFGFTTEAALDLSKQVQELASDLTSFQNFAGGVEGASVALTKALLGESEQAKALGIVLRQNSQEYKDLVKEAIQQKGVSELQAKALAALEIATNQSKNAIGDYTRTSKQLANQLKLTGKIWDDLTIGIGKFLKEFTGFGGLTLRFNQAFRKMTDTTIGFLHNWQTNFGLFKEWIKNNILTIFLVDFPMVFVTLVKNHIKNFFTMALTMQKIFLATVGYIGGIFTRFFKGDFIIAIVKGLLKATSTLKKWGEGVVKGLKNLFRGEGFIKGLNDALTEGLDVGSGKNEKTLSAVVTDIIADGVKDLKLPLSDFESATSELPDFVTDFKKATEEAGKNVAKELQPDTGDTNQARRTQQQFAGAAEKGSVAAYSIEKQQTGNKTERDQLNTQKKIERNTRDQIVLKEVSI